MAVVESDKYKVIENVIKNKSDFTKIGNQAVLLAEWVLKGVVVSAVSSRALSGSGSWDVFWLLGLFCSSVEMLEEILRFLRSCWKISSLEANDIHARVRGQCIAGPFCSLLFLRALIASSFPVRNSVVCFLLRL